MIWKIAKKEFLLNLMTFKFAVGTILCVVLMAVFMPVLAKDYQQRLKHYNKQVATNEAELLKVKVYKNITPTIYRQPSVLSVFSGGLEKQLGSSAKIELDKVPEINAASAGDNPYLSIFSVFDASLIFKIVISVLALLIAYDVVSGEREQGTLKLIIAGTISRSQVLFGKVLAGLMTLAVPVTIAFIVGLLVLLSFPMVALTGSDWIRIALMYLTSLVFIAAMYNVGLLFSCLTRRSAISLVLGLFVWIVFVVVIPNGSVYLATQIHPLKPKKIVDGQIASLRDRFHSEFRQLKLADGGSRSDATGAFGNWYHRLCDTICLQNKQKRYSFGATLGIKYADKFWEVKHRYLSSLSRQKQLADNLSRVSPLSLYSNTMSALAETDMTSFQHFINDVKTHRNKTIDYVRSKTDNFSATSFFTPCNKEEMMEYGRRITQFQNTQGKADLEKMYKDGKNWVDNIIAETPSLDLRDLPRFSYQPGFIENLQRAILDLGLLFFINVVFFTLSFAAFIRYDVRSD